MRFLLGVAAGWLIHRYLVWLDGQAEVILSGSYRPTWVALDGTLETRNNVIMTATKNGRV